MAKKVNRQNIAEILFEYQLKLIDKTVKEAAENTKWRDEWVMTPEQGVRFVKYAIPLIKKTFKCSKSNAENTLHFFYAQFGLKIV